MVHGIIQRKPQNEVFPVRGSRITDAESVLTLYFPFTREEATSTEVNFDQSFRESTSLVGAEEVPQTLREALDAISEVRHVAIKEDCDEPSDVAIANAKAVLRAMHDLSPRGIRCLPHVGRGDSH